MTKTYFLDFKNSTPFSRKFSFVSYKEKLKTVFADWSVAIKIVFPHLITLIGVLFLNWNLAQIVIFYFIDIFYEYLFAAIKTVFNQNQESLKGVYIRNDFLNINGQFKGNLKGLKIRAILFNLLFTFIFIIILFGFSLFLLSLNGSILNISYEQILISSLILFINYLIQIFIFFKKDNHKLTIIGDYFNTLTFKTSAFFGTIFCIVIFYLLFGIYLLTIIEETKVLQNIFTYLTVILLVYFLIYSKVQEEYFEIKKNQTLGSLIVNYLRKYQINFQFLPKDFDINEEEIIEAKIGKKPIIGIENGYDFFMVIIDKESVFSEKILSDNLGFKNAAYLNTQESQEEFLLRSSQITPFGGILGIKTYMKKSLKDKKNFILDLGLAGKIKLSSKDYFRIESPEFF